MEWGWLQSALYGLVSGLTEFLPVSSGAHRAMVELLTGAGQETAALRLICHICTLLALLVSSRSQLNKLRREQKLSAMPSRRRKRQPDPVALLDIRVLKTAGIVTLLTSLLLGPFVGLKVNPAVLAIFLVINGWVLYLCGRRPAGNRDSQSFSGVDALLMGLACGAGTIPGFSHVGLAVSAGQLRGGDRQYALKTAFLLFIPAALVLIAFDTYFLVTAGVLLSLKWLISYLICAIFSFTGAYASIIGMRFLAVRTGFAGFAYYCWGAALFDFILYLMI